MAGVNKVMIQLGGYIEQNIPKLEIVPKEELSFLYIIQKQLSKNPFTCQADQKLLLLTLDKRHLLLLPMMMSYMFMHIKKRDYKYSCFIPHYLHKSYRIIIQTMIPLS